MAELIDELPAEGLDRPRTAAAIPGKAPRVAQIDPSDMPLPRLRPTVEVVDDAVGRRLGEKAAAPPPRRSPSASPR